MLVESVSVTEAGASGEERQAPAPAPAVQALAATHSGALLGTYLVVGYLAGTTCSVGASYLRHPFLTMSIIFPNPPSFFILPPPSPRPSV
jgi:hypothetical protein